MGTFLSIPQHHTNIVGTDAQLNSIKAGTAPASLKMVTRRQLVKAACARVRKGEVSRARQLLTAAELAPGTEATWEALTDPERRPPEPRDHMPSDVMAFTPDALPRITPDALAAALRTSKRGSAPGLSGMRAEHLQVLLQDAEGLELLAYAGTCLARAEVPSEVVAVLAFGPPHGPQQTQWGRPRHCDWRYLPEAGLARPCQAVG